MFTVLEAAFLDIILNWSQLGETEMTYFRLWSKEYKRLSTFQCINPTLQSEVVPEGSINLTHLMLKQIKSTEDYSTSAKDRLVRTV